MKKSNNDIVNGSPNGLPRNKRKRNGTLEVSENSQSKFHKQGTNISNTLNFIPKWEAGRVFQNVTNVPVSSVNRGGIASTTYEPSAGLNFCKKNLCRL